MRCSKNWICCVGLVALIVAGNGVGARGNENDKGAAVNAHSFKMKSLAGDEIDLKKYAGKVVLAVNVASRCGYTPQYAGLQALHEKYQDKGLAVLGFPCNQFGSQEPGSSKDIAKFCESKYNVTFDMFDKVDVNESGACDLYQFLTTQEAKPVGAGPVRWNFEKFLVGKDGQVVARFRSGTAPDDAELIALIEKQLAE